ncbi:MAG: hypothetical protein IPJ77_00195 [Planctomycetes bacterium]|nr:hypothetical protein [Planctomycetota bacterium]
MGRQVIGVVGRSAGLGAFARQHGLRAPVMLEQGFALLPLRDEDLDALVPPPASRARAGFAQLNDELVRVLERATSEALATDGRPASAVELAYVELDAFGGTVLQGAAVFRGGKLVLGPTTGARGPIDDALRALGVEVRAPARDAYEALGFDRHRGSEDELGDE